MNNYLLSYYQYMALMELYNNYNEAFKALPYEYKSKFEACLYNADLIKPSTIL